MRTLIGIDDSITVRERRLLLLRHTFSGASVTPPDQGPSITTAAGTPSVSGGVLKNSDANQVNLRARTGAANLVVQWKTNFGNSAGTDRRAQIRVRHNVGVSRYNFVLYRSSDLVKIQRFDSGTTTTDIASVAYAMANSTDYWCRAIANGSSLTLQVSTDGAAFTTIATATDSTYLTCPAGSDFEIDLIDNVASPTIQVDDLLIWRAP